MTIAAITRALEATSVMQVASIAGCTRQHVNNCRRKGRVPNTPVGRKIAAAMAKLSEGKVTAADILLPDTTGQVPAAKRAPSGDRKLAGAKHTITNREKAADQRKRPAANGEGVLPLDAAADPPLTMQERIEEQAAVAVAELDWSDAASIAETQRKADTQKKIADSLLAKEKFKQAKIANAVQLGTLVPQADVKRCIEQAGVAFRKAGDVAIRQVESVVCSACKQDVSEALAHYTETLRQDVMTALRSQA